MIYLKDIQLLSKEEADEDFQMVLEDMKKPDRKFYFLHMELKGRMSRLEVSATQ